MDNGREGQEVTSVSTPGSGGDVQPEKVNSHGSWGERRIFSPKDTDEEGTDGEASPEDHLSLSQDVGCGLQACVQRIKETRQARISPARTRRRDLNGHHHRAAKLLSTSDINVDSLTCMLFPVSSLFLMMFAVLRVYNFC